MLKRRKFLSAALMILVGGLIGSCNKFDDYFDFDHHPGNTGYVYTMSNDAGTNSILIYKQQANGKLTYKATVNSGGAGSGMGLGSQGALVLDKKHRQLYTVNAGDNSISSFKVSADGSLRLKQTISSGGAMPVSLTVHHSLLYVVNGSGNICGFNISGNGELTKLNGSMQPLSSPEAAPAEILFRPDGDLLVVTEKATNQIATYKVNGQGVAQAPEFYPAQAETPFGFVFAHYKFLIVTNAFSGAPGASTVTSLNTRNQGKTELISDIATGQAAACWVILTKDEDYALVTNTGSNTISTLKVLKNGSLKLIDADAAETGGAPIDIIVSGNGKFAYVVNSMAHSVGQYKILPHGKLQPLGEVPGLPPAAAGIVAF